MLLNGDANSGTRGTKKEGTTEGKISDLVRAKNPVLVGEKSLPFTPETPGHADSGKAQGQDKSGQDIEHGGWFLVVPSGSWFCVVQNHRGLHRLVLRGSGVVVQIFRRVLAPVGGLPNVLPC